MTAVILALGYVLAGLLLVIVATDSAADAGRPPWHWVTFVLVVACWPYVAVAMLFPRRRRRP